MVTILHNAYLINMRKCNNSKTIHWKWLKFCTLVYDIDIYEILCRKMSGVLLLPALEPWLLLWLNRLTIQSAFVFTMLPVYKTTSRLVCMYWYMPYFLPEFVHRHELVFSIYRKVKYPGTTFIYIYIVRFLAISISM